MLIFLILMLVVLGGLSAAAWFAWQATPGPRSNKALAAGATGVALPVVGVIFAEYVVLGIVVAAVVTSTLGVATGRLSFWKGVAAGLGAPVVAYGGLILAHILHGIAFPATCGNEWPDIIDGVIRAQAFGVEVPLLLIALGGSLLAAACVAGRAARVWLIFIGSALVLCLGIIELHRHWELVSTHLAEPRTWLWILVAKTALFALFSSLIVHGRRRRSRP